jgi:uncharacterized protein
MSIIRRYPLITYFVLAYAITWATFPLVNINPMLGIIGFIGPAGAAILVTALTEGRAGVRRLLAKVVQWRVKPLWYVVALLLPVLVSLGAAAMGPLFGKPEAISMWPVSVLTAVLFVLVVGEELGWRGYALPKLLEHFSPLVASLILGIVWVLWHLPTFLFASMPQSHWPPLSFLLFVMGLTFVMTWVFLNTEGSVLIATLMHGAANTIGFTNTAMSPDTEWRWAIGIAYVVAAVIVVAAGGLAKSREGSSAAVIVPDPVA